MNATQTATEVFDAVSSSLKRRYGLTVGVGVAPADHTMAVEYANLRDGRIQLSPVRSREQQGFVLAHVFGHLVQYLDAARYIDLIHSVEGDPPISFRPGAELAYFHYEMEAFAWGEALMRQCMAVEDDLLNRYRAYAAVDFGTYLSYLKTGVQTGPATFQELLVETSRRQMPKVWDCGGLTLPPELITDGLAISVL